MQDAARQMQFQILRIVNGGKQEVRQRMFLLGWGIAHRRSEIALRVIVDEKYALAFIRQSRSEIQSSRRLTDATFLIGDCKNCSKRQIVLNLSLRGKMEETRKEDGFMVNELACLNCGKGFIPTCHITRQKFCSSECRVRYNNAKRYYTDTPVNECPECGTPIKQSGEAGRWRRFCGKRCRQLYHYKKWKEKQQANYQPPIQICPNCGKDFQPEWGPGMQRRFCGDACRIQWWTDYRRANPSLEEKPLWCECCGQALRMDQKKYCSRACYLRAMEETHRQQVCA